MNQPIPSNPLPVVVVFVHPAWPWKFIDSRQTRSDARRARKYAEIIERAVAFPRLVLFGSPRISNRQPPAIRAAMGRLAGASSAIIPAGDNWSARRERELASVLEDGFGDAPIVLTGFYRNLCVSSVKAELERRLPHRAISIDRVNCPARLIY